jgi:hypothetical protein
LFLPKELKTTIIKIAIATELKVTSIDHKMAGFGIGLLL